MLEFLLYLIVAMSGYFTIYQLPPNKIESLIIQQSKSVPMIIARIALILFLFIAIPININPGRTQVINVIKGNSGEFDKKMHVIVTLVYLFGPCVIGIFFPKIDSVFSFLGGACSTLFGITFPCLKIHSL
jgi:amino acid permease